MNRSEFLLRLRRARHYTNDAITLLDVIARTSRKALETQGVTEKEYTAAMEVKLQLGEESKRLQRIAGDEYT